MRLILFAVLIGVAHSYTIHRPTKTRVNRQTGNEGQGQGPGPITFFNQTIPGSEFISGNFPDAQGQINQFQGAIQGQGQFPSFPNQGQFPSFPNQGQFPSFPNQGQFPSFPNQGQFPSFGNNQGQLPSFPGSNQIPFYQNFPINFPYQGQGQEQQQNQGQSVFPPFSRGGEIQQSSTVVPIVSYEYIPNPDGSYKYSYETGDGIRRTEEGSQKLVGEPPESGNVAKGSYSYKDPNGIDVVVNYIADENGFQASGTHIPTLASNQAGQNNGVASPAYHNYFRNDYTNY